MRVASGPGNFLGKLAHMVYVYNRGKQSSDMHLRSYIASIFFCKLRSCFLEPQSLDVETIEVYGYIKFR